MTRDDPVVPTRAVREPSAVVVDLHRAVSQIERAEAIAAEPCRPTDGDVDIGGGLPARYAEPIPPLEAYGSAIAKGIAGLPYPVHVVAEPGRALVAEAGVLATTVIGVAERHGRRWIHLDVGAFNGMMETLETRRETAGPDRL